MVVPDVRFERTWKAVAGSVPVARHAVREHLLAVSTSEPPLSDICLAVTEAVTNVVRHAYRDDAPGPVRVRIGMDDDHIDVSVDDRGSGMAPRPDSPGLGLGLPLLAAMSDSLEIHAGDHGGTRVSLRFHTGA